MYSKKMFKKDMKQLKMFRIMSKFLQFDLDSRVAWKRADLANKMGRFNAISEPTDKEEEASLLLERAIREYYKFHIDNGLGAIVCMENGIFIPAKCSK